MSLVAPRRPNVKVRTLDSKQNVVMKYSSNIVSRSATSNNLRINPKSNTSSTSGTITSELVTAMVSSEPTSQITSLLQRLSSTARSTMNSIPTTTVPPSNSTSITPLLNSLNTYSTLYGNGFIGSANAQVMSASNHVAQAEAYYRSEDIAWQNLVGSSYLNNLTYTGNPQDLNSGGVLYTLMVNYIQSYYNARGAEEAMNTLYSQLNSTQVGTQVVSTTPVPTNNNNNEMSMMTKILIGVGIALVVIVILLLIWWMFSRGGSEANIAEMQYEEMQYEEMRNQEMMRREGDHNNRNNGYYGNRDQSHYGNGTIEH